MAYTVVKAEGHSNVAARPVPGASHRQLTVAAAEGISTGETQSEGQQLTGGKPTAFCRGNRAAQRRSAGHSRASLPAFSSGSSPTTSRAAAGRARARTGGGAGHISPERNWRGVGPLVRSTQRVRCAGPEVLATQRNRADGEGKTIKPTRAAPGAPAGSSQRDQPGLGSTA